jgi:hypothetical protein
VKLLKFISDVVLFSKYSTYIRNKLRAIPVQLTHFNILAKAFVDFKAHTGVVVGAFPETCLVIIGVDSVGGRFDAPVPFAGRVNEVVDNVLPSLVALLQHFGVVVETVEIQLTDNTLGLYPPVLILVILAGIVALINHRAIAAATFQPGMGNALRVTEGLREKLRFVDNLSSFKQKPRGFDVVTK